MLGERVKLFKGGSDEQEIAIEDLEIPDICCIALWSNKEFAEQIVFLYTTSVSLKQKILDRQPDKPVFCALMVVIPDVWAYAVSLTTEERDMVLRVWHITYALVRHLLPDGEQITSERGSQFQGKCWC